MLISKLAANNIETLLKLPETGMGYQLINAHELIYSTKQYLILNGKFAIETGNKNFNEIFNNLYGKDPESDFRKAKEIRLTIKDVITGDKRIGTFVKEGESGKGLVAKDAAGENANGDELFVRLSAFEDDIRIDKHNKCLLPGSYSTTAADALRCKTDKDNPVQRYALPNELEIKWSFHIQPFIKDTLQRGWVQPQPGKRGGGREAYFEKGTSYRTFITQTKW